MKDFLLDLIYPKYCIKCKKFGEYICPDCFANIQFSQISTCIVCQNQTTDGQTHTECQTPHEIDGIISGVEYNGIIKTLMYQLKNKPHIKDLASIASDLLYEALLQSEPTINFLKHNPTITSVPLSSKTKRTRGYNQAEEIAKKLSEKLTFPYLNLLQKKKDTSPQSGLKKKKYKNVNGIFKVQNSTTMPASVLLIDDVVSSGATIRECAKVLKKNGVQQVLGIAFARD